MAVKIKKVKSKLIKFTQKYQYFNFTQMKERHFYEMEKFMEIDQIC
jgi:hypothetical protein